MWLDRSGWHEIKYGSSGFIWNHIIQHDGTAGGINKNIAHMMLTSRR